MFTFQTQFLSLYIVVAMTRNIRGCMMYRIETTDPITGNTLEQLMDMPFVIESNNDDSLVIYFESEYNRDLYLENPGNHKLEHYHRA